MTRGSWVTPVDVVTAFWARMQARDWAGARVLLHDDVVVELPATGERFTSADRFIEFNATYPDGWELQVQRVVDGGPSAVPGCGPVEAVGPDGAPPAWLVVSEVQLPQEGVGTFAVAQFAWVSDGLIVAAREFWVTCAGEEPAAWRAHLVDRYDGHLA